MPYDPPNQPDWPDGSSGTCPSINVAGGVTAFQGYGLGVRPLQHELGCGLRERAQLADLVRGAVAPWSI